MRQSEDKGKGGVRGRSQRSEIAALTASSRQERLEYIAAMVQELKIMAARAGFRTLAGLLDMACREALQRRGELP
jgi:hypothetical protein